MNIPQRWRDVLSAIQAAGFPEAIIAGGALRDLDNAAPVKDVDIFVQYVGSDTFERLCSALTGYEGIDATLSDPSYQMGNSEVLGVYDFHDASGSTAGPMINVIACSEPSSLGFLGHQLERFDIGICQIAFDGVSRHFTSAYCVDKAERQLRIVNPHNVDRSVERVLRIGDKYPGWRLVNFDGTPIESNEFSFDVV